MSQESGATYGDSADPMQDLVQYEECYILLDVDGDGISERRKICKVGDTILHNEPTEHVPFAVIPYKLMPHEFYAPSLADDVMDLQLLKSQVWRMTMDSLYLSINPRQIVIEGQALLDDVLNPTPGGVIRAKSQGAVMPMEIPFVGAQAQPMLELIEQEIEGRTPVSRYYQGLDPKAVNKTATGMSILTSRNQAQAELVARLWAETGVKWLMTGILWLLSKHDSKGMMIRMRNQYIQVDPRAWTTQYDFSVNVGLGTGNKQEQLAMLNTIGMAQAQAVQAGGMGMLVEPKHIYNLQSKVAQLAGFKIRTCSGKIRARDSSRRRTRNRRLCLRRRSAPMPRYGVPPYVKKIIEEHYPPLPIVLVNGRYTTHGEDFSSADAKRDRKVYVKVRR